MLEEVNVTTNKNTIPFDPESPFITSGIMIGTPAVTTRGMKEEEMKEIAEIIDLALDENNDRKKLEIEFCELCSRFRCMNKMYKPTSEFIHLDNYLI